MFVNYPVDIRERNPAEAITRFCEDNERGGYVFRNRWADRDDIVVTLFLNSNCPGGSWRTDESGDFRIAGFGEQWAIQGWGYAHGAGTRPKPRIYMNVLQLSEPAAGRQAAATHAKGCEDGSGVVSMNLDEVYRLGAAGRRTEPADAGIRGMRSFAVDYSGLSGAPCLVAVVDKVSGTKGGNFWQLCTELRHEVTTGPDSFTIRAPGGASLRGTVAAPKAARLQAGEFKTGHEANYNFHQGHFEVHFVRRNVDVHGGEFFFVVMTLQRGTAPVVSAAGEDASTVVHVGERTIRFDGEKIVLEAAPRGWRHDGSGLALGACPPVRWAKRKNILWTAELADEHASAPVVSRGRVFMTAPAGTVLCLDGENGAPLWRKRVDKVGEDVVCLPPAARDGIAFAAFASGTVACLNGEGEIRWTAKTQGRIAAPPRLVGDRLVVQAERPVALRVDDGKEAGDVPPLEAGASTIVAGGLRYTLTDRHELLAVDARTGEVSYHQSLLPVPSGVRVEHEQATLMLVGDLLYACNVGAERRTVIVKPGRAFEKVWEYAVADAGPAWDAPAFAHDRQYVRGGKRLFCIGGTTPAAPVPPTARNIAPAQKDLPAEAPTNPLAFGATPQRWVALGPFAGRDLARDDLAPLGGCAGAALKPGDSVALAGGAVAARALGETHFWKHIKFTGDLTSIDITAALDRKADANGYFFTVVETDAPRCVRFDLQTPADQWNTPDRLKLRAWLAGAPVEPGQLLVLEKGRYPLLVQAALGAFSGDGKVWMAPRFTDETAAYLRQKRDYEETSAWWPEYESGSKKLFVLGAGGDSAGK
jgi:hypothetical protein